MRGKRNEKWLTAHPLPPPPPTLPSSVHGQVVDLAAAKARLAILEQQAAAGDLWEQRDRAEALLRQITGLKEEVEELEGLGAVREDLGVAVELMELEVGAGPGRGWCRRLLEELEGLQDAHGTCPPSACCRRRRRSRRWGRRRRPSAPRSAGPWTSGSCGGCWGGPTTSAMRC